MSFLFPTIFWIGLPLVAVPILIHLINLRRQRRISWAAMQFLLESQRRNKRSILLKQLLLLLARMGVVALVVLLLSHLVIRNEWLSLVGRGMTHHLVLLDDSYSMSDRWDNTTALAEGQRAIQAIVDQAYAQPGRQVLTLLRFSEAARLSAGDQPNVYARPIDDAFRSELEALLTGLETSETDIGPADALRAVPRLPLGDEEQTLIVYLLSDFRAVQFDSATEVRELLADLEDQAAQIHLVRCVEEARPNLAITALEPESGVRAAGVEMWMNVTVANYGDEPARGVILQIEQDGDALPAVALEEIPAGGEFTHKFRVQFAGTGAHSLVASLPPDAVEIDNHRYFACDLPAARPVLIVDGSRNGWDGSHLALALAPGGTTPTGWQPAVGSPLILSDPEKLAQQAAVCLLDVSRLAEDQLSNLQDYVAAGGGLAVFLGSEVDRGYYNERLYRDGEGLFPAPLKLPTQLLDRHGEDLPDVEVMDHRLFRVLAGRRNSFLSLIMVDYYYATDDGWLPDEEPSTQVIAQLRNGDPLVVEKKFGEGRVVAHLTKLSPAETTLGRWTNWSVNPVFPVLANELIDYLAAGRQRDPSYNVGDDLVIAFPESEFEPTVTLVPPARSADSAEEKIPATAENGMLTASLQDVGVSGIYEVGLESFAGEGERRNYAFNVPAGEGDLTVVERDSLADQLAGVRYVSHSASEMTMDAPQLAGWQLADALLVALILVLLVEQLLAYAASYHMQPLAGARR